MEKFPADVVTAEEKTDGDPKIVENFDFETKPKLNSWGDIFTNSKSPKTKAKSKFCNFFCTVYYL